MQIKRHSSSYEQRTQRRKRRKTEQKNQLAPKHCPHSSTLRTLMHCVEFQSSPDRFLRNSSSVYIVVKLTFFFCPVDIAISFRFDHSSLIAFSAMHCTISSSPFLLFQLRIHSSISFISLRFNCGCCCCFCCCPFHLLISSTSILGIVGSLALAFYCGV